MSKHGGMRRETILSHLFLHPTSASRFSFLNNKFRARDRLDP